MDSLVYDTEARTLTPASRYPYPLLPEEDGVRGYKFTDDDGNYFYFDDPYQCAAAWVDHEKRKKGHKLEYILSGSFWSWFGNYFQKQVEEGEDIDEGIHILEQYKHLI